MRAELSLHDGRASVRPAAAWTPAGLVRIGQLFVGVAFIGLGFEHCLFDDFITGRAPAWPSSLPGKPMWACASGAAVAFAGSAMIARWHARAAAIALGLLIFAWALVRHIPIVVADDVLAGSWTRAGKALTFFGGAFALAATMPLSATSHPVLGRFLNASRAYLVLGRVTLGTFLLVAGLQHFKFTPFVASLIPPWFPGNPTFWSYFAGVALIAGGVGLWVTRVAPLAALLAGLMVFSWFWVVHLPRTLTSVSDGIAVFEALAVSGIALLIAGAMYETRARNGTSNECVKYPEQS
jgi:uncharacterized membrane protein